MNKHTKGPWEVAQRPCNGSNQVWPVATGLGRICTVMDGSRSNANAKLIAAAPEMLAGLIEAADYMARLNPKHEESITVKRLRAIIAKARGAQ